MSLLDKFLIREKIEGGCLGEVQEADWTAAVTEINEDTYVERG